MITESKRRISLPRSHEMSVCYSQLFCASLLLGILAGCSSKEEKPAPPPPGVTATPVVRKDVDIQQEWVGTMLGNVDAEIRPKVEGFLLTQTSLSAHQELAKSYEEQLRSIGAYRESVRLSLIRYDSGLANYLEIVDAEIQMYPAERSAIIYDLGRKVALVDLYRSLGGGWNLNDSQWVSGSGTIAPPQTPP
jgi:hypothetical protein